MWILLRIQSDCREGAMVPWSAELMEVRGGGDGCKAVQASLRGIELGICHSVIRHLVLT